MDYLTEIYPTFKVLIAAIKTKNLNSLINPAIKKSIQDLRDLDYQIRTYNENEQDRFIRSDHNPGRIFMFFINYCGEKYLEDAKLTIKNDDLSEVAYKHTNTYQLKLKDKETHDALINYNPKPEDKPYDFDSIFKKQISYSALHEEICRDTTATAYDKFTYQKPKRTFDFKSAYWKKDHDHGVDYILQLDFDGNLKLFTVKTVPSLTNIDKLDKEYNIKEDYILEVKPSNNYFLEMYKQALIDLSTFNGITWDDLIIDDISS